MDVAPIALNAGSGRYKSIPNYDFRQMTNIPQCQKLDAVAEEIHHDSRASHFSSTLALAAPAQPLFVFFIED
ncbi:MAG TPA: hypothetical protein VJG32_14370 [Anaerolineae bacterium]|nr:hypothetical protein [Anaerolineae bacterium]